MKALATAEEVRSLWPLSENYEYSAEIGLAMRMHFPRLWEEWQNGEKLQRFPLPQALAFQFLLFCEKDYPEILRESLPTLLHEAPQRLQEEWLASLQSPTQPSKSEETEIPSPESSFDLFSHPFLAEYNGQSAAIHRWSQDVWQSVVPHTTEKASESALERVHAGFYLRSIRDFALQGGGPLTPETHVQHNTWDSLLLASGTMIETASHALQEGLALAELAPGSHHAGRSRACGTCLVNHLAVGAEWALRRAGVERVAILDIDAHHGNGTEEIYWDRSDVLTVSVHQSLPFFPGTGSRGDRGSGRGYGYNWNIEVQGDWIEGVREGVRKAARFQPELLLVQFGADAHWSDPASDLGASGEDFLSAGKMISELGVPLAIELGSSTNKFAWTQSLKGFLRGLEA